MKSHSHLSLPALLAFVVVCRAEVGTDSMEGLQVVALVNLDMGGVSPFDLSVDNLPLDLADAELGFGLRPRPEIGVNALLVHEDGKATFDQAFATWTSPAGTFAFGKQNLPVGLFAARLIHDPQIQVDLETIAPSILARGDLGRLALQLGLAAELRSIDSSATTNHPTVIAAIDYSWSSIAKIRLSGKCAHHLRLIDLGMEIDGGPIVIDLEGLAADGAWVGADYAALAGVTWRVTQGATLSTRFDARKPHGHWPWSKSIAVGAFQRFANIAYVGAEWLQDLDDEGWLTLRWGLEIELLRP